MILLVALIEPHYEINLSNKVYNMREIDCKCAFTHGDHYVCVCSQRGQGNIILCYIVFQYMVETAIALCFISFTYELKAFKSGTTSVASRTLRPAKPTIL